jgi:hypothetical protein
MREPLRRVLVWGWLLVVVALVAAVIAYVWWGGPEADRSTRAGVFGTLVAIASIVPPVAVWAWKRRSGAAMGTSTRAEVDAAANKLAEQTVETWSRQVVQRGIQSPAPVRVRWQWAADDVALQREDLVAAPPLATDPGRLASGTDDAEQVLNSGLVTRLHNEVYARLHHGRLVMIGGPGAGKTGAMILLLLEALRHRERMPETARTDVPVPVWLTLGSWDPRSEGLRDWVTATTSRDHPYLRARDFGPDAVAQLFDTGRIALFLDGLDEMPDTQRREAIERLTAEAAGRRLVITSRPDEFRETIDLGRRQLPYTAVIELRPVGPKAAAKYLLEGQIGAARQAWQAVADHLLTHPNGVLAKTLNTPLTLSLARAAYGAEDPRELLARMPADEHELRVHLLDHVLIAAYPNPRERAHATYWLGWLAHKMGTQPTGPTRDLSWWQIPNWIPRWQVGLVGGLSGGLSITVGVSFVLLLIEAFMNGFSYPYWLSDLLYDRTVENRIALSFGLFGGLVVGLMSGLGARAVAPQSMAIRWPKLQDLRSVASVALGAGLVGGLAVGCVGMLLAALEADWELRLGEVLVIGLGSTLFGALWGGLAGVPIGLVGVWRLPLAKRLDVTPSLVYRRDVRSHMLGGLVIGLLGGLVIGLVAVLVFVFTPLGEFLWGEPLSRQIYYALMVGLIGGFMGGLVGGLGSGLRAGAAPLLRFTEMALWPRERRVRFMPLLESALDRQVLRQAGAVYQFRHADLQDRLAEQYEAGTIANRGA